MSDDVSGVAILAVVTFIALLAMFYLLMNHSPVSVAWDEGSFEKAVCKYAVCVTPEAFDAER